MERTFRLPPELTQVVKKITVNNEAKTATIFFTAVGKARQKTIPLDWEKRGDFELAAANYVKQTAKLP